MSGFEFRGRNVADSRPVVHAPGAGLEPYSNGLADLQSAWGSMGYAKSMLRRAEHHLHDAEKPAVLLNGADKPATHDYSVMVDRIPSYRITNSGCSTGAVVDNFGRTSYMKAKVASSRKISRLEDKYVESRPAYEEPRRRSPLREPNHPLLHDHACTHHDQTSAHADHICTHRTKHTDHLVTGLPHSKYLDSGEVTGVSYDSQPTKDYPSYITSHRSNASNGYRYSDIDTTDPQAVRETNIHFLNDNINNPYKSERPWSVPARLTHVGVHVPGSHPGGNVLSHYGVTSHRGVVNGHLGTSDDVTTSGGSMATNTTYTVPSPDSGLGKKLRRNLKSSDRNAGGLAKLREKILLQRKKTLSPHENDAENACSGQDLETMAMRRVHHRQDDPVTPNTKTNVHYPSRTVAPTRKIASAPPAPTYKGFSETEIRFKTPDGKIVKTEKKSRKVKAAPKVHRHPEAKSEEKVSEKASRILAEKKKTSRYERKDIITTRSWRVGQQLILRELGPSKVAKTGKNVPHSPPTHDRDDSRGESEDERGEEKRKMQDIVGDRMKATRLPKEGRQTDGMLEESREDERNESGLSEEMLRETVGEEEGEEPKEAPLSRTAKSVLEDLFSDKSDSENQGETKAVSKPYPTRTPVKRKRPQSHEREKEERNLPKVRHYDSDEVRKYIAKQRAERKKKLEEEEKARQEVATNRRKQLEELYKKQKETARQPVTGTKSRTDDRQADGSRHRKDGERDAVWSDLSDLDSVNLHDVSTDIRHRSTTRDVEDIKTSAAPGGSDVNVVTSGHGNIDEMIDHYATQATDASRDAGPKQLTASEILQQYTQQTGLRVEDVVNEYTHQVEALRHQATQGGYSRVTSQPLSAIYLSYPAHPYSPTAPDGSAGPAASRTRAQRIQAIKDAATALKTRLSSEVQKMASHDLAVDPTENADLSLREYGFPGESQWVQPRPSDYSRYDRMAGTASDYNVFTTDLPGVMSQAKTGHHDDREAHQNEAATKIQAAYRGHTVRQDTRTESSHKPSTRRQHQSQVDAAAQLSDDSISSGDSTLTNEPVFSSYPAVPFRQSSLDQPDFCAAQRTSAPAMVPASHKHPDSVPMKPNLTWNKDIPDPDPFSVLNILARRQLHRVKAEKLRRERATSDHNGHSQVATDYSSKSAVATDQPSQRAVSERPTHTDRHSRSAHDDRSVLRTHSRSAHTLDDISTSYKDDFTATSSASAPGGASRTAPSQSRGKSTLHSSPDKTITSEGDDTLEATLTPSDSDDDQGSAVQKSSRRSTKTDGVSSRSLVVSGRVMSHMADHSDVSELSSLGEEDLLADLHPTKSAGVSHHGYVALQMSPAALEHRHAVELHLLDSMEVSMRQLTDVERTRAMTLAQQETVSLAQILKGRQQSYDHRMAEMQLRGHQEALEKERKLEAAQKRAAEVAHNMAAVQDDVLSSLRGAASKLLQTQSEAARVTADAALQLTQAKLALVQPTSPWQPQNSHQVAAAAGGSQPLPFVEEGTQYSVRTASAASATSTASADESYTTSDGFETLSEASSPKPRTVQSDSERRPMSATPASDASIPTACGATASDTSEHTASTVQTEPGAATPGAMSPGSQSAASVTEEVPSAEKDHSIDLDTSNTEVESSMRELVPSVGQRKKLEKEGNSMHMDECSFSSADDFQLPSMSSSRRLSFEEDSFTKFTIDMMKQYMQEEEIRAQHQRSLLKLRERALKEKTRAELAWLEQQKQRHRDKGADEIYPQIKKRERALVLKLQQEKDKIKRMQEANRVASKERQLLLKQSQEIARLRQSTHKVFSHQTKVELWLRAVKPPGMCCPLAAADYVSSTVQVCEKLQTGKAKVHEEGATEDELSIHLDEDSESSPNKDYRSDSEQYASSSEKGRGSSPTDPRVLQKLKKLKLDEKYLTKREQILCRRRKNAEKLMEWKRRLDEEEATVERLEKEVLVRLDSATKVDTAPGKGKPVKAKTPHSESIATETAASTAADFSLSPRQAKGSLSARTITEEVTTATSIRSAIHSSVPEEISSRTSSPGKRTRESGKDSVESSVAEEYANETFESSATEQVVSESATQTTVQSASQKTPSPVSSPVHSRLSKLAREKGICLPSPRSPILTAVSISESEDSSPITHSETPSDQSDVEGRIRALNDDLKKRKREAERLKKEQKKQEREKLKEQEKTLKKQIEVYDTYIAKLTSEPNVETSGGGAVKPETKEQRLRHGIIRSESNKSSEGRDVTDDTPQTLISKSSDTIIQKVSVSHDVSMDGSGDSSSPSKKALTTEQQSSTTVPSTALTPSGDKSESSEICEEISQMPTDVASQSELHLKLHNATNDDVSDGGIRNDLVTPRSDIATPRSDDYTTPHSDSHHEISAPIKSIAEPSEVKSVAPLVETSQTEAKEEGKDEGTALSESGSSRTLTEESRSERSEKSEHSSSSSKTYSQDFTSEATESGQWSRTEDASKDDESIKTEEDISEELSVEPDSRASSPRVLDLTSEVKTYEVTDDVVLARLAEGRHVLVGGVKSGVLRFKGKVEFAPGVWAGVELEEAEGTNDGTKDGVKYFSCQPGHGLFVPPDKITDHPSQVQTEAPSTHEDIVTEASKTSIPEEESTAKTKSSPRDTHTPIDIQTPPIELVDDEQTADDISIATVDSELDRVISSADAGVMAFELDMSAEAEVERVLKQESDADAKLASDKEDKLQVVPDTDVIAHNLLTEAIGEILNIRKQKREQLTQDVATVSDDSLMFGAAELISPFERPSTPLGHMTPDNVLNKQDELDKLYEEIGSLTGDDDGWMDDDFGLSVKPHKPPPPYPLDDNQQQPAGVLSRQDLCLDLHKLTQEVFYAVPHSVGEVTRFAQRSVDVFWQKRRCGEPWTDVSPPDSYYGADINTNIDVDTRSSRVYKKLVFDLTGEILCEMYTDEEEVAPTTGAKVKSQQRRYFKEKYPPRTVEILKPIVESHVANYLGLGEETRPWSQASKWGGRKKKDHVDQLLVQELRAEEPDWLDYDDDELAVKIQIADMIFESLLSETAGVVGGVFRRKLTSAES